MVLEVDYNEIKQSEPTALFRIVENTQNNNRLGLTTLIALSMATSALGGGFFTCDKDINFNRIGRYSYTNLEISNIFDKNYDAEINQTKTSEDYFDFAMKPIYTNEFKIKVKSFKIEKFTPFSF